MKAAAHQKNTFIMSHSDPVILTHISAREDVNKSCELQYFALAFLPFNIIDNYVFMRNF